MPEPLVSVIVVQWNGVEMLRDCLSSLLRETAGMDVEVIVFDNGSTDGSPDMVEHEFPAVRLIRSPENLGFAGGNNRAAKYATGRYLLLLNSDTEMLPLTVRGMAEFLDANPDAAACSPSLREPGGRLQPLAFGYALSLRTWLSYFLFLSTFFPRVFKGIWHNQEPFMASGAPLRVGWLCGACLMMRRDVFEGAGGFDEGYHMYCEDFELGDRMPASAGLYFLPYLQVVHVGGGSSPGAQVKWLDALFQYIGGRHGRAYAGFCRVVASCGFFARGVLHAMAGMVVPSHGRDPGRMFVYARHCLFPASRPEETRSGGTRKPAYAEAGESEHGH